MSSNVGNWGRKLKRIVRREGTKGVWLSFRAQSGIGFGKTASGIQGVICLSGTDRRKKPYILRLLRAYDAMAQEEILEVADHKPQRTYIAGLTFADESHVVVVLDKLLQRCFPLTIPVIEPTKP
jgi:hypothetical protein